MRRAGEGTQARINPGFVQPALAHDVTAQPGYYTVLRRAQIKHTKTCVMSARYVGPHPPPGGCEGRLR